MKSAEEMTEQQRNETLNEINDTIEGKNNLIVVTQLPIIQEQLAASKVQFEEAAARAKELECTEENLSEIKKTRANITKVFASLEERRKEAKRAIMAPYDEFEKVYKSCVTDIYKPCDTELAAKIKAVEESLKADKRKYAAEFFAESVRAANIDFLTLEQTGLTIGLTTSKKSIKEKIGAFVAKVTEELALVETQEFADEILVEYKQSLNVANAITTVTNRHKAAEAERVRREQLQKQREAEAEAATMIEKIAAAPVTPLPVPTVEMVAEPPVQSEDEPILELTFTVRGTRDKLRALKAYMLDNGYDVR